MARPEVRIGFVQGLTLLAFALAAGRAAQVQLVQHERWAAQAASSRTDPDSVPARRGTIYDRHHEPLAVAQDFYTIAVAGNEVRDADLVLRVLGRDLRKDTRRVREAIRGTGRNWVPLAGLHDALEVEPLRRTRGVYLTASYRRAFPSGPLARPLIGGLAGPTGRGASGLELQLDSLLAGVAGEQVFLRDREGRRYESPARRVRDPVDGHDVVLTLDAEMQAIAEAMLTEAIRTAQAEGGDVVILDPRTGEVLAMASRVEGGAAAGLTMLNEPFEPGSTAKLFTAAALLRRGDFDTTRTVEVGPAPLPIPGRARPIEDAKVKPGTYTLARAVQLSSNVATVQFGALLRPEEHYDMLRDFGFGTRTGFPFPAEEGGTVPRPHAWRAGDHSPSISMGYGFEATTLQLALAYAAVANGGWLPTPALVREIVDPAGRVVFRHEPEMVRQVITEEVARVLMAYLGEAAGLEGTGAEAQLAAFRVAGKTGTSRLIEDGRYVSRYVSTFAGIFPADDPQLVVVAKIRDPRGGEFYGGETAAPLVRHMLERALQARQSALNRARLARAAEAVPRAEAAAPGESRQAPVVVLLPVAEGQDSTASAVVPPVAGMSVRQAAQAVFRAGFQVRRSGSGTTVLRTTPAPGASRRPGTTVTLETGVP